MSEIYPVPRLIVYDLFKRSGLLAGSGGNLYAYLSDDIKTVLNGLGYDSSRATDFEIDYFTHSADKQVARAVLIQAWLEMTDGDIEDPDITWDDVIEDHDVLIEAVKEFNARWSDNIKRIYAAYTDTYNPLNNYDMEEDIDYTPAVTTTTTSKTASKTKTENDNSIYGFNSATPVPSNKSEATTSQLQADNETEVSTSYDGETDNTHTERKGNIGVMSTQDLIGQEVSLRKLEILELIFNGLDSVLCQAVY